MKVAVWTVGLATLVQVALVLAKATGHVDWGWALAALAFVTLALLVFMAVRSVDCDCDFGDVADEEEGRDA